MAAADVGVEAVLCPRVPFGAEAPSKGGQALVAPKAPIGAFRCGTVLVPSPATAVATAVTRRAATLPPSAVVVATAIERQVAVVGGALPLGAGTGRDATVAAQATAPSA